MDLQEQYLRIHERIYPLRKVRLRIAPSYLDSFTANVDPFGGGSGGDQRFLSDDVAVVRLEKGKQPPITGMPRRTTMLRCGGARLGLLRTEVGRLLSAGQCPIPSRRPRSQSLESRVAAPTRSRSFTTLDFVPPQQEAREDVGRNLIYAFLSRRLIPLAVSRWRLTQPIRSASPVDRASTRTSTVRLPRRAGRAASGGPARVVVQPDFSVIVIGLNPAPAAELALFCERTTTASSQGLPHLENDPRLGRQSRQPGSQALGDHEPAQTSRQ